VAQMGRRTPHNLGGEQKPCHPSSVKKEIVRNASGRRAASSVAWSAVHSDLPSRKRSSESLILDMWEDQRGHHVVVMCICSREDNQYFKMNLRETGGSRVDDLPRGKKPNEDFHSEQDGKGNGLILRPGSTKKIPDLIEGDQEKGSMKGEEQSRALIPTRKIGDRIIVPRKQES